MSRLLWLMSVLFVLPMMACDADKIAPPLCDPARGKVVQVIDGDTIKLESGETVRLLLVDTPELSSEDCFSSEAQTLTERLLLGQWVDLKYDAKQQIECFDRFDRLLAYVYLDGHLINKVLLERGYGKLLLINPVGRETPYRHKEILTRAEQFAKESLAGLWGGCP